MSQLPAHKWLLSQFVANKLQIFIEILTRRFVRIDSTQRPYIYSQWKMAFLSKLYMPACLLKNLPLCVHNVYVYVKWFMSHRDMRLSGLSDAFNTTPEILHALSFSLAIDMIALAGLITPFAQTLLHSLEFSPLSATVLTRATSSHCATYTN